MAIQTANLGTAPSGAGGDTFRSAATKFNENFTNNAHAASRMVGTQSGNLMEVGALGLGLNLRAGLDTMAIAAMTPEQLNTAVMQGTGNSGYEGMYYYAVNGSTAAGFPEPYGAIHGYTVDQNNLSYAYQVFTGINGNNQYIRTPTSRTTWSPFKKVMRVGDAGVGVQSNLIPYAQVSQKDSQAAVNGFWSAIEDGSNITAGITASYSSDWFVQIKWSIFNGLQWREFTSGNTFNHWKKIYHSGNTTVDSNGFVKAASPIIKLFADKIELNDEAEQQDIVFEKLGIGDYLIKGSSGFTQEGWYIETPKDANGNLLVAVVYEQLENGDISVKTYDYMLNKKGRIVADTETPLDIPENRWIDIRLQALPPIEYEIPTSKTPADFQPTGIAQAVATVMESYHDPEQ